MLLREVLQEIITICVNKVVSPFRAILSGLICILQNKSGFVQGAFYGITSLFSYPLSKLRIYNEANSEHDPDDYGLFLARLAATPSLSGLAAIAGVLITTQILQGGSIPSLSTIFKSPSTVDYLLAAAAFGLGPNLILTSLQQKIQKYATDLQNTKGEVSKEK
jgi:hypothetical protein